MVEQSNNLKANSDEGDIFMTDGREIDFEDEFDPMYDIDPSKVSKEIENRDMFMNAEESEQNFLAGRATMKKPKQQKSGGSSLAIMNLGNK